LTQRWSPAYPLSSCLNGSRLDNDMEVEQHPLQPEEQVFMQIKQLTIWRSTFYARDFLSQPPMLSFKELDKVYSLICTLCYLRIATQLGGLRYLGAHSIRAAVLPRLLPCGELQIDGAP
jgi:hypothetical protein